MPAKHDKTAVRGKVPVQSTDGRSGGEKRQSLGEILVDAKAISRRDLQRVLETQSETGDEFAYVVVKLGVADEATVARALAKQFNLPFVDLTTEELDPDAVGAVEEDVARDNELIGVRFDENGSLVLAIAGPADRGTLLHIAKSSGRKVRAVIATRSDILERIDVEYRGRRAEAKAAAAPKRPEKAPGKGGKTVAGSTKRGFGDVEAQAQAFTEQVRPRRRIETGGIKIEAEAPVIQIVNRLVEEGLRARASDIHLEPQEDELRVRFRIDGTLHDVAHLPAEVHPAAVSRIKILADMDIVERQRPQDGQFSLVLDDQPVDIRAATTTTIWGEKVVLRLLSKQASIFKLTELGMDEVILEPYMKLLRSAYGMLVVAGPTGSGKTTTLYATLSEIDRLENNITTIEDPVEYVFEDINQIQIKEAAGISFASGLKSILRQDPDVILVGEMRDAETARIAVQSALTGHLVLSSMHATDSTSALYRFLDMGIEGFLVASSVIGIVAQRLVRRVCSNCAEPFDPPPEELAFFHESGGTGDSFVNGRGCDQCSNTGYRGRLGIFELLRLTGPIKNLVVQRVPHDQLRAEAAEQGIHTLLQDAVMKIEAGQTTINEVLRKMYVA